MRGEGLRDGFNANDNESQFWVQGDRNLLLVMNGADVWILAQFSQVLVHPSGCVGPLRHHRPYQTVHRLQILPDSARVIARHIKHNADMCEVLGRASQFYRRCIVSTDNPGSTIVQRRRIELVLKAELIKQKLDY